MDYLDYAVFVESTNFTQFADASHDATHHSLSLCSEAGEIAGKIVKRDFRGSKKITNTALLDELGDVVYHVVALCNNFGMDLQDVWTANAAKLQKRVNLGTLVGEGDSR